MRSSRSRFPSLAAGAVFLALWCLPAIALSTAPPVGSGTRTPPKIDCPEGTRLFNAGDLDGAEAAFTACAEENPGSVEILLALAMVHLAADAPMEALQCTARAMEIAPESPDVLHRHGQALLGSGDADGARGAWETGLRLSTEHPGLLGDLALLQLREGNEPGAYGLLTQLARTGMASPKTHRTLSDLARKRGLWQQALFHWRGYLDAKPDWAGEDLRQASELAIMARDTSFAVDAARRAYEIEASPASHAALGRACFAARRLEEARTHLQSALAGDPNDARSRFNLANTLQLLGRLDEAEGEFRHYVTQAPDDPLGFYNFATQLQQRGKLDEALLQVEQACALDAEFSDAFVLKANLQESLGDDAGALETVNHLLSLGVLEGDRLEAWKAVIRERLELASGHLRSGQFQLQHMLIADRSVLDHVMSELKSGADFAQLVVRFSIGPTAATGGSIGWVDPQDMDPALADVIGALGIQEISPPVESGGLFHIFKRLR